MSLDKPRLAQWRPEDDQAIFLFAQVRLPSSFADACQVGRGRPPTFAPRLEFADVALDPGVALDCVGDFLEGFGGSRLRSDDVQVVQEAEEVFAGQHAAACFDKRVVLC